MSNTRYEYECAMTGVTQEGSPVPSEDEDGLDDLPIGWTKIHVQRRQLNPEWIAIQQVKEAALNGILMQLPEEVREAQRPLMSIQVRAQFHALEASIDPYVIDVDDVIYISDSEEATEAGNEVRELLGLPPVQKGLAIPEAPE